MREGEIRECEKIPHGDEKDRSGKDFAGVTSRVVERERCGFLADRLENLLYSWKSLLLRDIRAEIVRHRMRVHVCKEGQREGDGVYVMKEGEREWLPFDTMKKESRP